MANVEEKIELHKARAIAEKYLNALKPLCDRIEIAGSIRREKSLIGDIELVCIPKSIEVEDGLFGTKFVRDPAFTEFIRTMPRVKGKPEGKYTQLILPDGMHLDLFMTTKEQWGVIFMIRTGSAEFSQRMVTECKAAGYYVEGGYLKKNNEIIPCPEEEDFFRLTRQEFIKPFARMK